ncbi:MoxR family ATPase [Methanoculleus sp. FWC-SCC1]|uniref:MoxR family ATPase n=1 Tax=Methanoculleus frigidifontis TaxID=2584085 RepID=A0ABT8MBP3_9EURY|nr:MoxR family ATPase [Methanoculleus sp. FWC-SCC1]MDN7025343.1 MoxR family ATPase [Methanoculleus sp. FWC-SCC1]
MHEQNLEERIASIASAYRQIQENTHRYIVGDPADLEPILIGIFAGGNVLIEGVPGTAKTTISKILAGLISFDFKRVQCAVDVQPADIIGLRIYDQKTKTFSLIQGPIFSNFLVIDEINRLTPRTQSAFLEAMGEGQTTIDGVTYPLAEPFFTIATQNPYELEGTFPLVEAQKDRFMLSTIVRHLDGDSELKILRRSQAGELDWTAYRDQLTPVITTAEILRMHAAVREVYADEAVLQYIRDLVIASREHENVRLGASSRGSLALLTGAKVRAAFRNRTYIIPDDVKALILPVLQHRIILEPEAEIEQVTAGEVVDDIVSTVEVP